MPSQNRGALIVSDHSLLRVYQNKLSEEMVRSLYISSSECVLDSKLVMYKYTKYKHKNNNVKYFWSKGYLLTVDVKKNVLITIHKQPRYSVKLK